MNDFRYRVLINFRHYLGQKVRGLYTGMIGNIIGICFEIHENSQATVIYKIRNIGTGAIFYTTPAFIESLEFNHPQKIQYYPRDSAPMTEQEIDNFWNSLFEEEEDVD